MPGTFNLAVDATKFGYTSYLALGNSLGWVSDESLTNFTKTDPLHLPTFTGGSTAESVGLHVPDAGLAMLGGVGLLRSGIGLANDVAGAFRAINSGFSFDLGAMQGAGLRIGRSGFTTNEFANESFVRLQGLTDTGYGLANAAESRGLLTGNPNTRVGAFTDRFVQARYLNWLDSEGISEGPDSLVQVNRWLRDPTGSSLYARPDVRIPSASSILDPTVSLKWGTDTQIIRFSNFSGGDRITIVRPQVLGGSYSIWP